MCDLAIITWLGKKYTFSLWQLDLFYIYRPSSLLCWAVLCRCVHFSAECYTAPWLVKFHPSCCPPPPPSLVSSLCKICLGDQLGHHHHQLGRQLHFFPTLGKWASDEIRRLLHYSPPPYLFFQDAAQQLQTNIIVKMRLLLWNMGKGTQIRNISKLFCLVFTFCWITSS